MSKFLKMLRQRSDLLVSVILIAIIAVMLIPLPPFVLDLLLSMSIAISVVIMITAVYVKKPLDFSVFPSLLLITTLYRLSLNIASTKLILLHGHEGVDSVGNVIKSFGNFVVGGNYAVGLIVFLILVLVNFVVITRGSGRIAEVAARFTLDAMPGKQMAIDADLNAGLIDEAEARKRRDTIRQEADFYGAMDGASKFVRGDAIAGLIITGVNIFAGLLIGILQQDMPILEAGMTYTVLTVGDGIVTQIPALLISTAAGIVVSRAGKDGDIGSEITSQMLVDPKALYTAAGILFVFGIVPGLPHIPFFFISAAAGGLAYVLSNVKDEVVVPDLTQELKHEEPTMESLVELDPLTLEIGYGLIPLVEGDKAELLNKVKAMRRQLAKELGFIVPSIHIKDNLQLRPHEYSFLIRGVEEAKNEVMLGYWLAVASEGVAEIEGIPAREPAFGLPAYWIEESNIEISKQAGYMVVDPSTVITTHVTEIIRNQSWEILSRTEVQSILNNVTKAYPKIVDELIPGLMSLGGLQRVLQNLLKERVPINDILTILETLLDYAATVKDFDILTEYVRQALARYITRQYMLQDGGIHVITLDSKIEGVFANSARTGDAVSPDVINIVISGIEKVMRSEGFVSMQPIILCSSHIRRHLRRIIEKFLPSVVVIANTEITSSAKLFAIGTVTYEEQKAST
ncbi:MAG: flagellar biosynthesis protein FlhA [Nitrospirae bacterium]|nr:flagellar biosynthesis protein FlhA [Nitrospirota bacterium]